MVVGGNYGDIKPRVVTVRLEEKKSTALSKAWASNYDWQQANEISNAGTQAVWEFEAKRVEIHQGRPEGLEKPPVLGARRAYSPGLSLKIVTC